MPIKVLLADNDFDIHKLIADLLPLLFKKVIIDRALNYEMVLNKLSSSAMHYNLVVLDIGIGDEDNRSILTTIAEKFPQLLARLVVILDTPDAMPSGEPFSSIARVIKPFSLDEFSELAKKACTKTVK